MRMSQLFVQTLREAPGEARLPGYQFLWRAGFVRPSGAAGFAILPLGLRVREKIEAALHQALEPLGGQAISLPLVTAAETEPPVSTGSLAGTPLRIRDRGQRELALAAAHRGSLVAALRGVLQSYRQLPLLLYHVWPQYSDMEPGAPGLFGAREALLADAYSLHADSAGLAVFYPRVAAAYHDLCHRCDVPVVEAIAALEGETATAHRLVYRTEAGDRSLVRCPHCGYTADQAIAPTKKVAPPAEAELPREDVETPDCKTIADLAGFLQIPTSRTAKALFLVAGGMSGEDRFVFAVVRGDTNASEEKLKKVLGAQTLGAATEAEIRNIGAEPGYGSPIGVQGAIVVVDDLVAMSPNLVAGANRHGYHTLNVNHGRDFTADIVADIALAETGSPCPRCGSPLVAEKGVELASMAQIGAIDAGYLDREGRTQPVVMGHYRLYLDRLLAAVAESHCDAQGLMWPAAVAPFGVYLMTLGKASAEVSAAAEQLCTGLAQAGIDVLYDDRDERAGVKFNDADLIGLPVRLAVGDKGLQTGTVEVKKRTEGDKASVLLADAVSYIASLL